MPMRRWHIFVSSGVVLVVAFLLFQDSLARIAWRDRQWPTLAVILDRRDAALALQIGNYYFGGGGYSLPDAERAYRKAVQIQPNILWGHYELARISFVRGDSANALKEIAAELSGQPNNLRSLYVRGLIYGYQGNLAGAEADFRRFTQWAPLEWAGYNDLAWILEKQANYSGASAAIDQAFGRVPDASRNPWLWNSRGVAELNLGNHAKARDAFKLAQTLANGLSAQQWKASYPGNDPAGAETGLAAFKNAIAENIRRSEVVDK